ncbi:MAG TPA: STAS domain-containing protein [Gemmataceae bacterium]|jgi:anti-anti-sigma factor|nr:STAS domain-containing protein [Gemmataceae bacterium]
MARPPEPAVQSSLENGVLVLTILWAQIEGEDAAHTLGREIQEALARTGATAVVVDLQHTRFLSSAAFWPLLNLRRQLLPKGGRLMICGLSGAVEDVFCTTRMVSTGGAVDAPFQMAPDRAAAVARLSAAAPG